MRTLKSIATLSAVCLIALSTRAVLAQATPKPARIKLPTSMGIPSQRVGNKERLSLRGHDNQISRGCDLIVEDGEVSVDGGTLTNLGVITIKRGGKFRMTAGALAGDGTIDVEPGGLLEVEGAEKKEIANSHINNDGNMVWGGSGLVQCSSRMRVDNKGNFILNNGNGKWKNDKWVPYDRTDFYEHGAEFVNKGKGRIIPLYPKGGHINGNLENRTSDDEPEADSSGIVLTSGPDQPLEGQVLPSPSLLTVTGTFAQSSGYITVNISQNYYGQLNVASDVSITGGTLKVNQQYVHAIDTAYYIIVGTRVTGEFATRLPSPFQFLYSSGIPYKTMYAYRLINKKAP